MARTIPVSQDSDLVLDLDARPSDTPTFTVVDSGGALVQGPDNATLSVVNTTLSAVGGKGAFAVTVSSATGILPLRKYWVSGGEAAGGEQVTVKSVSGTTVTLYRALNSSHASGATFQSSRIVLSIDAISSPKRHYRAIVAYEVDSVDRPSIDVPFDVVRYYPYSALTLESLSDLDPILRQRLPLGSVFPALKERSWSMLLDHLAAQVDPGAVVGTLDLTTAHGYLLRALLLETAGPDYQSHYDLFWKRYITERDSTLSRLAVDNDQDGAISTREGFFKSIQVSRA